MPVPILMPALSPTMEKGKLAKWHVSEGDRIKAGDVIAEIETDKATMEVEAIEDGLVAKLYIKSGTDDVMVNTAIALIETEEEAEARSKEKSGNKADINVRAETEVIKLTTSSTESVRIPYRKQNPQGSIRLPCFRQSAMFRTGHARMRPHQRNEF